MARGYRVIRFDNRDCGLSGRAPGKKRAKPLRTIAMPTLVIHGAAELLGSISAAGIGRANR